MRESEKEHEREGKRMEGGQSVCVTETVKQREKERVKEREAVKERVTQSVWNERASQNE